MINCKKYPVAFITIWIMFYFNINETFAQDYYVRAKDCAKNKNYTEAIANFEKAVDDNPQAAYDYARYLLNGELGKIDTAMAIWYLTDLACYGHSRVGYWYGPFLKGDETLLRGNSWSGDEDASTILKQMESLTKSEYIAVIYDALGKYYGAEGDFIKAEDYFRKAYNSKYPSEYYCIQDVRLSLGIFYLLIDCDYIEHEIDTEGGIPFENLGILNSTSLRVYNSHHSRNENDNAIYWLELYKKRAPNCFEGIEFTAMTYPLHYVLLELYKGSVPNNPKDVKKEKLIAGEMFLSGQEDFLWDENAKDIADFYYNNYSKTQAWELYRIAKCNLGMGKCYYDYKEYYDAMKYLSIALVQDTNYTREEAIDALSLISSIYRYGKGGIKVNERLADKILDISRQYNSGKKKLYFTTNSEGIIIDLELKKI